MAATVAASSAAVAKVMGVEEEAPVRVGEAARGMVSWAMGRGAERREVESESSLEEATGWRRGKYTTGWQLYKTHLL